MENYRIICEDMPLSCKAYSQSDANGFYTIYLNSRHSAEQNKISLYHELKHIKRNDFDKADVSLIESLAHAM